MLKRNLEIQTEDRNWTE